MEETYFVPSLLFQALDEGSFSAFVKSDLHIYLKTKEKGYLASYAIEHSKRIITRFLKHNLKFAT